MQKKLQRTKFSTEFSREQKCVSFLSHQLLLNGKAERTPENLPQDTSLPSHPEQKVYTSEVNDLGAIARYGKVWRYGKRCVSAKLECEKRS